MKWFLSCLFLIGVALAESDFEKWQNFKSKHNKLYSNNKEETHRFAIFQSNLRMIEEHNQRYENGEETWFMEITRFADWTKEEAKDFLKRNFAGRIKTSGTFSAPQNISAVPDSIDWRQQGAVTGVKDQGECGGCWAFAAIGTTEGRYFVKNNQLISFSEQQLLDCAADYDYGFDGCIDGGVEQMGIKYLTDYGMEREADYPYQATVQQCRYDASKVVGKPSGFVQVDANEAALKAAVAQGPTTVAVDMEFNGMYYGGGIFQDTSCASDLDSLNHALTNVGYGSENGVDYWIVKNSWSTDWGEQGYIRFRRGSNTCGVETDACYAQF